MNELYYYITQDGRDVMGEWLDSLTAEVAARVTARIMRMAAGNFGDCKPIREGVREMRIHFGPGYRVYFAVVGKQVILLLCGGDKRRQSADIQTAIEYLKDYNARSE